MNTTDKEVIKKSINEFLKYHNLKDAIALLDYYLDIHEDVTAVLKFRELINHNPEVLTLIISGVMPEILKKLELKYSLIELSKNNNPILVY